MHPVCAELAQLAVGLADPRVRDTLYALAVGECADQAEALWALLARNLPDPWRVEALVLLAFSAYARGDGPLAGVSLDAALRARPTHRMAGMLDTALQSGMRPERIRELAVTGYRLAEQLGVRLPRTTDVADAEPVERLDLLDADGVRHVMGQLDLLVPGDHDHHAAVVVGLHGDPGVRHNAGILEPADELGVALHVLGELAHHHRHRQPDRELGEPDQADVVEAGRADAEIRQARDGIAERRGGGVVEHLDQTALDILAHHVLPAARLGVDVLPRQPDHVDEQPLGQPVLAHHGDRRGRGPCRSVRGGGRRPRAAGRRAPCATPSG